MTISVIIPAFNRAGELEECLKALRAQSLPPLEVIVVDDGSTDATPEVAVAGGARLIQAGRGRHPNVCRNMGASAAGGDLLAFFDSDTVPGPEVLRNAARRIAGGDADAVIGVYALRHRHPNAASQYKNLWIRYSYLQSAGHVDWIFGAVSVITRDAFLRAGGFDGRMMMTHGGEDLELGKRMAAGELRILLDPSCEVEHLKRHTLVSLLVNDYRRSDGFVRVAGQVGHLGQSFRSGFVNIYPAFAYAVPLSWVLAGSCLGAVVWEWMRLPCALTAALYAGLNLPFLVFAARQKSLPDAVGFGGILFLDHLACGLGVIRGLIRLAAARIRV